MKQTHAGNRSALSLERVRTLSAWSRCIRATEADVNAAGDHVDTWPCCIQIQLAQIRRNAKPKYLCLAAVKQ
jgi:hypothetical protein